MRFFSAGAALALSLTSLASAKPFTEESSTAVAVDRHSHGLLESGELVVHVLRTDDLLSDYTPSHERSLILERLTHLVLQVKLDGETNTIAVNDEPLNFQGLTTQPPAESTPAPSVQLLKASAFRVPQEQHVSKHLKPEDVERLAKELPQGVASIEVSIEKESTGPVAVEGHNSQQAAVEMESFRVFVKITEIEKQTLSHSTTVLVPILKVELTRAEEDGTIQTLRAYAIRPHRGGAHRLQHEGRPSRPDLGGDISSMPPPPRAGRHPLPPPPHFDEDGNLLPPPPPDFEFERPHRHHHHEEANEDESHFRHHRPKHEEDDIQSADEEDNESRRHHRRPQPSFSDEDSEEEHPHHHRQSHPHLDFDGESNGPHHFRAFGGPRVQAPPSFVRWIADALGYQPPRRRFHGFHHPLPPPTPGSHFSEDEELATPHRHHSLHDLTDEAGQDAEIEEGEVAVTTAAEGDEEDKKPKQPKKKGEGRRHRHKKFSGRRHRFRPAHKRFACRLRRFMHSPAAFLVALIFKVSLFSFGAAMLIKKIKKAAAKRRAAREGLLRLEESPVDEKEATPAYNDLDLEVVVVSEKH